MDSLGFEHNSDYNDYLEEKIDDAIDEFLLSIIESYIIQEAELCANYYVPEDKE